MVLMLQEGSRCSEKREGRVSMRGVEYDQRAMWTAVPQYRSQDKSQVREIQRERNKGEAHTGFQLDALFNEKEGRYTNELYLLRQWWDIGAKSEAVHPKGK
jgi:hypothetical protein